MTTFWILVVVLAWFMVSWRLARASLKMIKEGLAGFGAIAFTIGLLSLAGAFLVLQHRDERPSPVDGCYRVTRDLANIEKTPGSIEIDGARYLPVRCPDVVG